MYQYCFTGLTIDEMFLSVDDVLNPESSITCVTSGGPAVCVIWERDGSPVGDPHSVSTLVDPERGTYDHVLTVTEQEGAGEYKCTVFNDKPDNISGHLQVKREFTLLEKHCDYSNKIDIKNTV